MDAGTKQWFYSVLVTGAILSVTISNHIMDERAAQQLNQAEQVHFSLPMLDCCIFRPSSAHSVWTGTAQEAMVRRDVQSQQMRT